MDERTYLMWLMSIEGMTRPRARKLLSHFLSAKAIWDNPKDAVNIFLADGDFPRKIISAATEEYFNRLMGMVEDNNLRFIIPGDGEFPELLSGIDDSPLGLYIRGTMPDPTCPQVAIIGTRRCSEYGVTVTELLSKELANIGASIISGMARGIDARAHRSAIAASGKTIAVMGCGLDICYPPEHHELREQIIENGCLISEYPPGARPLRGHFPERNRIISGLSDAIVVIEAGEKSGTSFTISSALDQGRLVFAVPGSIFAKQSSGTNQLLKEGAIPVTEAVDIIAELMMVPRLHNFFAKLQNKNNLQINNEKSVKALARDEKLVYDCIDFDPIGLDVLLEKTGLQISFLNYVLVKLELDGLVRRLPGQTYIRCI